MVLLKRFFHKLTQIKTLHFLLILLGLFFAAALINILNHEMWRDELQGWLLARDSATIGDLFRNTRYEGHPILWHLGLFFISKISHNPFFMQIYHLLIATGVVFIVARYSPFTRLQKFLFSFGYYPLYEYAAISRNYSIGLLLMFASCAIYQSNRANKYIYLAIVLFLLAHTNIFGLILMICFFGYFFLDTVFDEQKRQWASGKKGHCLLAVLIVFVGAATSLMHIIPPPDSGYAVGWHTEWNHERALSVSGVVYKAFVPIPVNELHFWDTNIVHSPSACLWLSVALLIISSMLLVRSPRVLLLYLGGTAGLLIFMYVKYLGYQRHHGHLFILLVVSLWLAEARLKRPGKRRWPQSLTHGLAAAKYIFIILLLAANVYAGILSSDLEWKYEFSMGKAAAKYIKENGLDKKPWAGHQDYTTVSVCGYFDKKVYYPRSNREGSFTIFNNKREAIENVRAIKMIKQHAKDKWEDMILIFNFRPKRRKHRNIQLIKSFEGGVVPNEEFYICKPKPQAR